MAVEKMSMMNIVGDVRIADKVLKDLILLESISLVNALREIEENSFMFNVKDENIEKIIDLNFISSFPKDEKCEDCLKKVEKLNSIFKEELYLDKNSLKEDYDFEESIKAFQSIYEEIILTYDEILSLEDELESINKAYKNFMYLQDTEIHMEDLRNLKYFNYDFGVLTKEDRLKLKKNYENILAAVLHTGTGDNGEVYLIIYPSSLEEETTRILRSLNFNKIDIPEEFSGTPQNIIEDLHVKKSEIEDKLESLEKKLEELKKNNIDEVQKFLSKVQMAEKIEEAKENMACSQKFFYLSAWVPASYKNNIEGALAKYEGLLITFKDESEISKSNPPTKLKNNKIFRPFETLVKMYGTPSYNELDPTPFLSITYMLLFGAMFGDLGQGLVLLLGGYILSRKKGSKVFGGLVSRLGISSMIFGTLYGAFFGFEDVIPALLIRPFENIDIVLKAAIAIGILLLFISYIFSMLNSIKRKDLKDGLFGKDGLVGFMFYILLLLLIGGVVLRKTIIPKTLGLVLSIVFIALMILKEPLSNLILGKRPLYGEDPSSYYIESSFSILETLLSMLSGTVSFIRVGAFALTHVGLFIAFQTIGEMIGTQVGNVIVLILGNLIIIGLEGLIVFIQGLRLQYYELFSRYYKGEGIEFKPIRIER
ncbi:V-type ATP synthase subunit I [Anaerosalibacter bizertensis]|uniref:V-type ATP synthase subunit I n=1 Tax=Anaerosalibacter bizertensis TaxID=932217 RepID=A0A844FHQ0_9FIRM|nr:V-type ATPase 116kDa subunit family protein [Anaerosalibacter bizertensis]MSS43468.1 V-type ATP synthase subunit I [Anaerosalibacter bizertensis]